MKTRRAPKKRRSGVSVDTERRPGVPLDTERRSGASGATQRRQGASKNTRAKAPARPRVPLPRQTGGVHEDLSKRPWRRRKHKGRTDD